MKKTPLSCIVWSLIVLSQTAVAQEEGQAMGPPPPVEDALLDSLVGTWQGTGTAMSTPCTETVTYEWVLGHQFLLSKSVMTFTMPDGNTMDFASHGYHRPTEEGRYQLTWLDNSGDVATLWLWLEEGRLVGEWTDPMGTHRSVMSDVEDGTFAVVYRDRAEDGSWTDSGSMTYTRVAE